MGILALTACSEDNVSDLQLTGGCSVTELALDDYEGTVDKAARTITVRVPETYDISQMTLSKLTLSDGAVCDAKVGDKMNMLLAQTLRVKNGDVFLDWTLVAKRDEAKILSFKVNGIYTGAINESNKTITINVPLTVDITKLIPSITVSENATVAPVSGAPVDFTNPVAYTVTNNTATSTYTVTVNQIGKPTAVFASLALTMDELAPEEKAACEWMLANVDNSIYASFTDIKNGNVDLSECKVIWWHFHKDGGVDGKAKFEQAAPEAIAAQAVLRDYYKAGGSFLFTRYATNMPGELGIDKNGLAPNNCWGQVENDAETCGGPWDFKMGNDAAGSHSDHALYQGLVKGDDANSVYTTDANYRITNSTAQWHIGVDWGGFDNYAVWREKTGAIDLGYGGDGAVVVWEYPAKENSGKTLCIGTGCYDWYSVGPFTEKFHANVALMTKNAFNYLMNH